MSETKIVILSKDSVQQRAEKIYQYLNIHSPVMIDKIELILRKYADLDAKKAAPEAEPKPEKKIVSDPLLNLDETPSDSVLWEENQ